MEVLAMGKHETGYPRSKRDFYPTRHPWVTEALLSHINVAGLSVLEQAAGEGHMAEVLKAAGAASVFCNDIEDRGYPLDQISDYTMAKFPVRFDASITNPPFGFRAKLAETFTAQHFVCARADKPAASRQSS
jgi:predicted RNA methylase